MLKFLFLGFVRIHMLHHACEGTICGTRIKGNWFGMGITSARACRTPFSTVWRSRDSC